ncbi:MAG: amidohydrolase family protein [Frankia sp.]|nr:amidohydrolase family protein [Frankia sp.]
MSERLVVVGGTVLTGPDWRPGPRDLLVEDGVIAAVGAPGAFDGADAARHVASGRLVIPGLVNAHTHAHTLPVRGVARDWTLEVSLLHGAWMGAARPAELAELCAVLAGAESLASGCTGVFDLVSQTGGPDVAGLHAVARGYERVGVRALVAPMVADRPVHDAVPAIGACCGAGPSGLAGAEIVRRCREYVTTFPALRLARPALAPTILAHCTPELASGLGALAAEHGLRLHTHLAESKPQALAGADRFGRSITRELARLGLLGERLTAAHGIWLDDADRELLAAAGAVVVTVPGSNLRLGSGIADTRALLAAGVRLAIGTDGANSADALDALDAARLAALLSRTGTHPPTDWLTVEEALDAATTGGATACGWSDTAGQPPTGRIAPGHAADLAFLDLGSRAFTPANDLANQLLTAARAADVTDVMVAGRLAYRDREVSTVDLAAATARFRDLVAEWHERHRPAREQAAAQARAASAALATLRAAPWPTDRLLGGGQPGPPP